MADGDMGHGYGDSLDVGVNVSLKNNKKAEKESTQAFTNIISLVSDLAIIGKVAGDALSKMWSGLQNSINLSLQKFGDMNLGMTVDVNAEDLEALKYALGQSGSTGKAAMPMLQKMDEMIQSFRNPATGVVELESFYKNSGVYNVDPDDIQALEKAINSGDMIEAIKLFAEQRNDLGDEFSNFVKAFGLDGLQFLENDEQYRDWLAAWEKSTERLFDQDIQGLDELEDAMNNISTTMSLLTTDFMAGFAGVLLEFSNSFMGISNKYLKWKDEKNKELEDSGISFSTGINDTENGFNLSGELWKFFTGGKDKSVEEIEKENVKLERNTQKNLDSLKDKDGITDKGKPVHIENLNINGSNLSEADVTKGIYAAYDLEEHDSVTH